MKKVSFWFCLAAFAALVVAPAFAADQSNIAARAATWEKEYNADNVDGVAALYASDGCRMPPNAEIAKGTAGIVAQLKAGKAQGVAKVKVAVTASESSGDMAYAMGTYEVTKSDGSHLDHGKWMNVSKKVNGEWKIACDIWNSDMTMPAQPAAK